MLGDAAVLLLLQEERIGVSWIPCPQVAQEAKAGEPKDENGYQGEQPTPCRPRPLRTVGTSHDR